MTASDLKIHYDAGHFPPGNMGPKVESVLRFLESGGREAVITSYEHLCEAIAGKAGTHIIPDSFPSSHVTRDRYEIPVGGR